MTISKEVLEELLSGVENANDLLGEHGLQQEISSLFYTQNGSTSEPTNSHGLKLILDLSRFAAAACARLSHLSFESDRAFPTQC